MPLTRRTVTAAAAREDAPRRAARAFPHSHHRISARGIAAVRAQEEGTFRGPRA